MDAVGAKRSVEQIQLDVEQRKRVNFALTTQNEITLVGSQRRSTALR